MFKDTPIVFDFQHFVGLLHGIVVQTAGTFPHKPSLCFARIILKPKEAVSLPLSVVDLLVCFRYLIKLLEIRTQFIENDICYCIPISIIILVYQPMTHTGYLTPWYRRP